jgi:hypothetical protein
VSKKERHLHQAPSAFDDKEWTELKRLSRLPDRARRQIDEVVYFLRMRPNLQDYWVSRYQAARHAFGIARKDLIRAIGSLELLIQSEAPTFMIETEPFGPHGTAPVKSPTPKLVSLLEKMRNTLGEFPSSDQFIPRGEKGRTISHLRAAVENLNLIVAQETGDELNQSGRVLKFVHSVCQKGAPKTTKDAVEKHIKGIKAAKRRR